MRFRLLILTWLATDLCLFVFCYAMAYFLRVGFIFSSDFPFDQFVFIACLTAPAWLAVLLMTRTFAVTREQAELRTIGYITFASLVGTSFFALTYYFVYGAFFSRLLLVYALLIATAATILWHIVYQKILRTFLHRDPPVFPTVIIGVTRESQRLIALLNRKKNPLKPVAILDAAGTTETEIDGVPVLGKLNKLDDTLRRYGITHMIQCSGMEQSFNLLSVCRSSGVSYLALPSIFGFTGGNEGIMALEGKLVTSVRDDVGPWSWFFA